MYIKKIDKHFVSNIDKFLAELRSDLPESASAQFERIKYERIASLRDKIHVAEEDTIWIDF